MTTVLQVNSSTALRVALGASLASLLLSGAAFLSAMDDESFERDTERRLACLELPGANDCGADRR